jgi:hypothetical protein
MSYALDVRDQIKTRLQAMPFFGGFNFTTNKSVQIQPKSIPFAGVYFIEETRLPDGDANVGEVRFRSTARYGISVIIQNNDAVAAENKLDEAMDVIDVLFADSTLYNWRAADGMPMIQAYMRGARSHQFGSIGQDNELPIAELRFDLTCDLGTFMYPPTVTDDFEVLHVKTQFPSGGTQAEIDSVQQITVEYNIPQMESSNLTVTRPVLGTPTLHQN